MAHTADLHAAQARTDLLRCGLALLLGTLACTQAHAEGELPAGSNAESASLRMHIGPPSRRGIDVGTLLAASAGREHLYAYVELQDRLPQPVRRVLRQADGGITVERSVTTPSPEPRSIHRANLGSMLRWRLDDGSLVAVKLQVRKAGLQVTVPMQL